MADDTIRRVDYWYTTVADRPGSGHELLQKFADAGVSLTACLAFPLGGGESQVDFVPADAGAFETAAQAAGIQLSDKKQVLYVEGPDRPGALAEHLGGLAAAGINCTATAAVAASAGRFGLLIWVKPEALEQAEAALA